ncbi:MAG: glycosyltransferase [Deltaproteobacteria bacterium]|nr:glycosyltransferase [Deltaproteobacteria bacterium]
MSLLGLGRIFEKRKFHASIDQEPQLGDNPSGALRGWVLEQKGVPDLVLCLGGQRFALRCSIPRLDVFRNLSLRAQDVICGFEVNMPVELLAGLPEESLQLYALTAQGEQLIWSWPKSVTGSKQESAVAQLSGYLEHALADNYVEKRTGSKKTPRISVVLETAGDYSRLLSVLETLKSKTSGQWQLRQLVIICDQGATVGATQEILKARSAIKVLPEMVFAKSEFAGWDKLFAGQEIDDRDLILHIREDVDFKELDLEAFFKDFLEIPSISLLMPTIYGGRGNVHGPEMLTLNKLRESSSLDGQNLPALFPTDHLDPIWLTSAVLLRNIEQELRGNMADQSQPLAYVYPPQKRFLYLLDLRQPVLLAEHSPAHYTPRFGLAVQRSVDLEVKWVAANASRNKAVIFTIADDWLAETIYSGWQYSILSLAGAWEKAGYSVIFVADCKQEYFRYFNSYPALSFHRFIDQAPAFKEAQIIVTSPLAMCAAQAIRYIYGYPLSFYLQEENSLSSLAHKLDLKERAALAYAGDYLPLACSAGGAWLNSLLLNKEEKVALPQVINKQAFFPAQHAEENKAVLLVFSNMEVFSEEQKSALAKELQALASAYFDLPIYLLDYYGPGHFGAELIGLSSKRFNRLDAVALADLYRSVSLVIKCGNLGATTAAEIAACAVSSASLNLSSECAQLVKLIQATNGAAKEQAKINQSAADSPDISAILASMQHVESDRVARLTKEREQRKNISLVMPVYNALDATVLCLRSLLKYVAANHEIIIVNDCSDPATTKWLNEFSQREKRVKLVNLEVNRGFVRACMEGVTQANAENDILLVNSDIVITEDTIALMQEAAHSRYRIGLVSTLSTNSPHLKVDINPEDDLFTAAKKIKKLVRPDYPTVITPEGQLLYIRRWALDKFGFFDVVFNRGFCEESDMSMRMFLNGVDMVVADNALIHHRRSASFGKEERLDRIGQNRPVFDARWEIYYRPIYREFLDRDPIKRVRDLYYQQKAPVQEPIGYLEPEKLSEDFALNAKSVGRKNSASKIIEGVDVVFILPSVVLGGGTLSVLQHVDELTIRGIKARVLGVSRSEVKDRPYLAPNIQISVDQLFELNWEKQIVVATFWTTAYVLKALKDRYPNIKPYYYIQDYEPWFYSHPENFPVVKKAERSYDFGFPAVAKTKYLAEVVKERHGYEITVITPGIDELVFYPGEQDKFYGRPRMAALYRPQTPRRGTAELIAMLRVLHDRLPELEVNLFGKATEVPEDLRNYVKLCGVLPPSHVAKLYRNSDIVVDLSFWHGFGRMGLEGMSCGAVPVLSKSGGVLRYAEDTLNSFLVDIDKPEEAAEKVILLAKNREVRLKMRAHGLKSSSALAEDRAVDDWLKIWGMKTKEEDSESIRNMPDIRTL